MYLEDYIWFICAILLCSLVSGYASLKVNGTFSKYSRVYNRSGMNGYDTATILLRRKGVYGITVGRINGRLSDHYNPARGVVNLSESTYGSNSVAAVGVAAHEIGHVMQRESGYFFYRLRTALVPIVNFGSRLAMPLVIIGFVLDSFMVGSGNSVGFNYIAMTGVILYGTSLLFALVTLPVELDASRRAKKMLVEEGILTKDELPGASKVLNAAAMTYLASLLTSLIYFLRFLVVVLTLFGRRNNRD